MAVDAARAVRVLVTIVVTCSLLLGGTVAAAPANAGATATTSLDAHDHETETYVIEQGEVCEPIEPLESGETIEEFYDYRNHETHPPDVERLYSSYGTTHLQADDTSILFLHDGPDGLSLVMVHDRLDGDSAGGAVDFRIDGLPEEAEWVVENDNYSADTNVDEFHRDDDWAEASWIWRGERTGGGAIQGGLDDGFAVTIDPAFNEEASHWDDHGHPQPDFYDGIDGLDAWEVLSGDEDDPDRTPLDMDEPVTIRTGACDEAAVSTETTADGIEATVLHADPDDDVPLRIGPDADEAVRFEHLSLTGIEGERTIVAAHVDPDAATSAPENVETLSHLTVTSEEGIADATGTVTFAVDESVLDDRGIEPDAIALYERTDDGWTEVSTDVVDEADGTYRFSAEVSSVDELAIGDTTADDDALGVGVGPLVALLGALAAAVAWVARRTR